MRTTIMVTFVIALVVAVPAATAHNKGSVQHRNSYLRSVVIDHEGVRAPGRNIVKDGVLDPKKRKATKAEVEQYLSTLRNIAFPPVAPLISYAASSYAPPVASASGVGGGAGGDLASIRACESGGNYSTNTGNGYSGSYQFDDSTWRAAGGSTVSAWQASPGEQDRVAANWIASGHRGAWPNC